METVNQIEYNGALYNVQDAEAQKSLVYSQNETDTGKTWINGKKIYRKVVNCGGLPDNAIKEIPHNIKDYDTFLTIKGIAFFKETNLFISLPFASLNDNAIEIAILGENVTIKTYMERRVFIQSYAILEYTKTTN